MKTRIDESSQFDQNALPQQVCESLSTSTPPLKTHDQSTATQVAAISATNAITQLSQLKKWKRLKCSFEIPKVIKENWMGVFGSIALVIGAVFFGLTAEIMQHAEIRVGVMMAISFLLLGISQKLKNHCDWRALCGWLKSIAGAVILFATLGAGGIEGLQFIYTPIYALLFLCFGIAINIVLAMTTASQGTASLHVILSIIAFCLVPQAPILLPIGALVAGVGLTAAYRAKWDLHLLLIVIAFGVQNTVWTYSFSTALLPWMHYLAVGCSLVVGSIAASVHYSKKYHSPKFEVLPLTAHITNWGVLIWNIWMHAQFIKWMPLVLAAIAAAGFVLARVAKKKNIDWLFYTDTLLSQLV
ncbi:MAG: hypothetical protein KDK40_03420, partial [Chlamydiia bacterium]|nr:hypothetical protein [Chlamydiia bacterium]